YDLSRGPIIGSKNENRIVPFTGFFDVIDDPTDVLIQYIDHGCINLHPAYLVPADRIRKSFPIIVAGLRPGIPVVQYIHPTLLFIPLLCDHLVTHVVYTVIFGDLLFRSLKWIM